VRVLACRAAVGEEVADLVGLEEEDAAEEERPDARGMRLGVPEAGVFEAQYLAQISMVRADSLTGAHLYTRSPSLSDISLQIARLWGAT
jgi:hypothetical protein